VIATLLELGKEDHRLHRPKPLADPGQHERLGGAQSDLLERRRVVAENKRIMISGAPREAVAAVEQLHVEECELHVAGVEPAGATSSAVRTPSAASSTLNSSIRRSRTGSRSRRSL